MNTTLTDNGVTLSLNASEIDSLAFFLAQFTDQDIVKLIGQEYGGKVNSIADQMVGLIVSPKESQMSITLPCIDRDQIK